MELYPVSGDAAVSPGYADGEERVLIATGLPLSYDVNANLALPATFSGAPDSAFTVAFSPDYSSEGTILFGSVSPIHDPTRAVIHECTGASCRTR